ncbi:hypothetical protein E1B28_003231 [Marasmius oreades]|uniref:Uncharacterized protein n=1 Tax=Marasmius oreades TaxID=181124 RepID=A0A9P7RM14_9AGAR|nr:uncharacterized protein E1B28_003231 [Marasmius oreades]KAG7085686.1 hypothetical protein E1B28_003231 [Marasmius oreades]
MASSSTDLRSLSDSLSKRDGSPNSDHFLTSPAVTLVESNHGHERHGISPRDSTYPHLNGGNKSYSTTSIPARDSTHLNRESERYSTAGIPAQDSTHLNRESERYSMADISARDSTHLIPSIMDNKTHKFHPLSLRLPIIVGVPISMFLFGVALEVGLALSARNNGFAVPRDNALGFASAQFLLAFVPTVLIMPVSILWRELDWYVRHYHPYVVLSRGNATADETLLHDYIAVGTAGAMINSLRLKHHVVFWSVSLALLSYTLQPLAGSIFQLQQRGQPESANITSTKRIGLSNDIAELNAFVSSAGFVEAAVYNGLPDPPFILGGWVTAEFQFPNSSFLNGTMITNTTGIQTKTQCTVPKDVQVTPSLSPSFTILSTSSQDCKVNVTFNPLLAAQQYGVVDTGCNSDPNLNVTFTPVMFWFFHKNDRDDTPEAKTIFCQPTIKAFRVKATASLNTGSLINVTGIDDYDSPNDVTGGELAGKAFNGLLFPPTDNPFINARGVAANSAIPGAILRALSKQEGGLQTAFDQPNGFLDTTTKLYTQHLSLSAKSIYFVDDNTSLPALMVSLLPRLVINPIPGHTLAIFMMLIGFLGLFVQLLHRRQRKRLFLAAPPSTMAAVMALSSHSGFGQLLMPYDNEETLRAKLSNLRFRLDRRTGALVADELRPSMAKMKKDRDESMQSLLGKSKTYEEPLSSSQVAFDAASGYPPWKASYKTPYDPEH